MARLVAKTLLFAVTLAALLVAIDYAVASWTPWRQHEDPRTRLLWDGQSDGSPVVLLGSSEFASLYVNSLSETLASKLERYSERGVFPGALNGSRPADVHAGAVLVSRT